MSQQVTHSYAIQHTDAFTASPRWTASVFAEAFFFGCKSPVRAAEARLRRMAKAGDIASTVVDAYPTPVVTGPLWEGSPGEAPDYGHIAYLAEQRWSHNAVPQRVYWPTYAFAMQHGGNAGSDELHRPHTVSHDLLVSAVWAYYLRTNPSVAFWYWVSECEFLQELEVTPCLPDAWIRNAAGKPTAVEIIGRYPADWIQHHVETYLKNDWNVVLF